VVIIRLALSPRGHYPACPPPVVIVRFNRIIQIKCQTPFKKIPATVTGSVTPAW
jgi:hypothetical protein